LQYTPGTVTPFVLYIRYSYILVYRLCRGSAEGGSSARLQTARRRSMCSRGPRSDCGQSRRRLRRRGSGVEPSLYPGKRGSGASRTDRSLCWRVIEDRAESGFGSFLAADSAQTYASLAVVRIVSRALSNQLGGRGLIGAKIVKLVPDELAAKPRHLRSRERMRSRERRKGGVEAS
jgi:hypothetical protein